MPLLYVDVLGVKARWRSGGPSLVSATFARLESIVAESLEAVSGRPAAGGIQSDALGLVFETAEDAVRAGRALFAHAFDHSVANPGDQLWLRGVVSPAST